jgi:transcription antitermination factor NusG
MQTQTMMLGERDGMLAVATEPPCDWHVLHTRSRQEKALSADLNALGVPHFLPLLQETRYHGRRKVVLDSPLFPGYLFLRGTIDDAYRADRTRRVAQVIVVADQEKLDWELLNLRAVLAQKVPLDPYPILQKGLRVEVRSGPFRGVQGLIEDKPRPNRLILQVDLLGKAVSLEIDGALLDLLS